ncbi:MAG: 4-fold beta flower protein, partial [Candidatus Latescibacterota bacterium]
FLKRHGVYSFNGIYLGSFKRGYFRDKKGNAVAFVEGALGEPPVPKVTIKKIPPKTMLLPIPPLKEKAPVSPSPRPFWSDSTFVSFLGEGETKQSSCPI